MIEQFTKGFRGGALHGGGKIPTDAQARILRLEQQPLPPADYRGR